MLIEGRGYVPPGYREFCQRNPGDCVQSARVDRPIKLDDAVWRELVTVNKTLNRQIRPVTDLAHYGVVEKWTYPEGSRGDCEDFALAKQRALMDQGFPGSALLLATAYAPHRGMHALLIARTDHGDFVLDNATNQVKSWNRTAYTWIARQSPSDPLSWQRPANANTRLMWASLGNDRAATAATGN